jgi:4-amino-4-deoxy-L-arabinose transferase-like glycosyltransferase
MKTANKPKLWQDKYLWILIVTSLVVILFRLGARTLYSWDEAIYGQIAREMLNHHHWLMPYWQNVPWFEKPPLVVWLMATSFKLFGISELAARLPSALAGVGTVVLTYLLSKRFVPKAVSFAVGLVLLTSYLFLHLARFATTDSLLVMFTMLSVFGTVKLFETKQTKWWLAVIIPLSLGFMTKNVAILPATVAVLVTLLIYRKKVLPLLQSKWLAMSVGIGLLLVVPWHIYMHVHFGSDFWQQYLGYHVLSRTTGLENNSSSVFAPFYAKALLAKYWYPWAYFAIPASVLWILNLKSFTKKQPLALLLLLTVLITCLTYQLTSTKLYWYMLPILPPLTIMIGWWIWEVYSKWKPLPTLLLLLTFAIALRAHPSSYVIVSLAIIAGYITKKKWLQQGGILLIVGSCIGLSVLSLRPTYQQSREFVEPLGKIMPTEAEISPMIQYKIAIQGPEQIYYTNRIAISMSSPAEITNLLQNGYQTNNVYTALNSIAYHQAQNYLPNLMFKLVKYTVVVPQDSVDELKAVGQFEQLGQVGNIIVGNISISPQD